MTPETRSRGPIPAAPIPTGERIEVLDTIRGFALLGIFIMNMPAFNTSLVPGLRRGAVAALVGPRHGNCPRRHLLRQVQQHVQHAVRRRVHDPARAPAGARAATRDADLPAAPVLAVCVRRRACLRLLGWRRPAHVCGAWIAITGAAPAAGPRDRGADRRVPVVSNDPRHDTDRDRDDRKTSRPSSPSRSRPSPRTTPRSVTAIFWTPPGAAPRR